MRIATAAAALAIAAAPAFAETGDDVTVKIRGLAQFDAADYLQSGSARYLAAANGPDLSSGSNFRRAYLGVQGKAFSVWSYNLNFDFGGSGGTEKDGHIQSAYVQYDGFAPFAFRIGAYAPPAGLEDSTSPQDTLFLERTAPSDVLRNTAAGDGRDAASVIYAGDRIFAALSFTGGKVGDGVTFDEQNALVGRISGAAYRDADTDIVLSGSITHVLRGAGSAAGPGSPRFLTLSAAPELTVDATGTKLVSTGNLDIDTATDWGVETGGNWRSLYAQAGYFGYRIHPQTASRDLSFHGWYAQASWVLTGERRSYSKSTAAFASPRPEKNATLENGGSGVWELAARYSDVDLDDRAGNAGFPAPAGGVRGGEQKIWTIGLNWYPDSVFKFTLDYQHVDVSRLSSTTPFADVGQQFSAVSTRAQISF
jgi:phosphate-selective porin OprO and OprP